jgi:O-antigen/teichoic acid export membrane protein
MADDLRTKVVSGTKWNVLTSYTRQFIALGSQLVLARYFLEPSDWGLVGAAMVVITIVRQCGNFGINYALIQRRGRLEEASHTGLTLLFVLSTVSYALVLAIAPYTKAYFSDAAVPRLTAILALSIFFRPVAVVAEGTLRREFHLRRIFFLETFSQAFSTGVAIGVAALLPTGSRYWALVVGGLGREMLRTLTSWYMTNVPIRFGFDRTVARELFHYGKFFVFSSIFMVLYANVERLTLGWFYSTYGLGLYTFAYGWVFHVGNTSATIFSGVAVPLYAKLQDEPDRLRESYCRILGYTALVSVGLLTGLVCVSADAVRLVLLGKYDLTIQTFQFLGFYYIVRALDTTTGQLYVAIGRPKLDMVLNGVNLAALAVVVVPLVLWGGPVGAAFAALIARVVRLVVNLFLCRRVVGCSIVRMVDAVMPAVRASAIMALGLFGIRFLWPEVSGMEGYLRLAVLIGGGALAYLGVIYLAHRTLFVEIIDLTREALNRRKKQRERQA